MARILSVSSFSANVLTDVLVCIVQTLGQIPLILKFFQPDFQFISYRFHSYSVCGLTNLTQMPFDSFLPHSLNFLLSTFNPMSILEENRVETRQQFPYFHWSIRHTDSQFYLQLTWNSQMHFVWILGKFLQAFTISHMFTS